MIRTMKKNKFGKPNLREAINNLLGTCHFTVENSTLRQIIGIPTGLHSTHTHGESFSLLLL